MMARPATKLSAAGKNLSKLVHSMDKKLVDYRMSDEEQDPYADSDDLDSEDDGQLSDASSQKSLTSSTANLPPKSLPPHLGGGERPAIQAPSQQTLLAKNRPVKRVAQDPMPESNPPTFSNATTTAIITKDEVVALLRNGPIRTKDLIQVLRDRLTNEASKEAFKDIIKRVASVRTGPGDDEKWLELKQQQ
jgi:hypothetical protein